MKFVDDDDDDDDRQTDKRTDGRRHSEREREFTFAKNRASRPPGECEWNYSVQLRYYNTTLKKFPRKDYLREKLLQSVLSRLL